jgi:hypothetical protein
LRNAVHEGSDLLKQVPIGPRFTPLADTIPVRRDSVRPRPDSTIRRPDQPSRPDSLVQHHAPEWPPSPFDAGRRADHWRR